MPKNEITHLKSGGARNEITPFSRRRFLGFAGLPQVSLQLLPDVQKRVYLPMIPWMVLIWVQEIQGY